MGIGFKLKKAFLSKFAAPKYLNIIDRENSVADQENVKNINLYSKKQKQLYALSQITVGNF